MRFVCFLWYLCRQQTKSVIWSTIVWLCLCLFSISNQYLFWFFAKHIYYCIPRTKIIYFIWCMEICIISIIIIFFYSTKKTFSFIKLSYTITLMFIILLDYIYIYFIFLILRVCVNQTRVCTHGVKDGIYNFA